MTCTKHLNLNGKKKSDSRTFMAGKLDVYEDSHVQGLYDRAYAILYMFYLKYIEQLRDILKTPTHMPDSSDLLKCLLA